MVIPGYITTLLVILLVVGVSVMIFAKKNYAVIFLGGTVVFGSAVGLALVLNDMSEVSKEESSVTALLQAKRPDAQLVSIDTNLNEIHYLQKGQTWPMCIVHYAVKDKEYSFEINTVKCQVVRPPGLQPSTTTTTAPPVTAPLFPTITSTPAS